MKKAVYFWNCRIDQRKIDFIDDEDVDEFDDLLDDVGMPPNIEENDPVPPNNETEDDCIVIGAPREHQPNSNELEMVTLEVDRDFSLEYCFTTDVR